MHKYLIRIRIRKEVFDLLKVEAKARGISINDFMTYYIEVTLAEYINEPYLPFLTTKLPPHLGQIILSTLLLSSLILFLIFLT